MPANIKDAVHDVETTGSIASIIKYCPFATIIQVLQHAAIGVDKLEHPVERHGKIDAREGLSLPIETQLQCKEDY